MTARSYYLLIAAILISSCSTSTRESGPVSPDLSPRQQEASNLEDQVIAVHDEVMPQLETLVSLKDRLESQNQHLESSAEPSAKDQVIINSLVIDNLDQAHEGMMDWMRNFQGVDLENDPDTNIKYLQEELSKINSVKDQVNSAIAAAEETLGE